MSHLVDSFEMLLNHLRLIVLTVKIDFKVENLCSLKIFHFFQIDTITQSLFLFEMAPRNTSFNQKWLEKYPWIKTVANNDSLAFCKYCKKSFSISTRGENRVIEHANSSKHKTVTQGMHRFIRKFPFLLFYFKVFVNAL